MIESLLLIPPYKSNDPFYRLLEIAKVIKTINQVYFIAIDLDCASDWITMSISSNQNIAVRSNLSPDSTLSS